MVKTKIDINAWCVNGVGLPTQSDGTTDEFGASVAYRFCDMRSDPVREVIGVSSDVPIPTWTTPRTFVNPTIKNYTESVVAIGNTGTAKTLDLTNGTMQTATLTGNCTFTMPTAAAGKSLTLLLKTGAGSFTGTFTGVKWAAATAPTITATAARMDILTFTSDGASWYGSFTQNYTP